MSNARISTRLGSFILISLLLVELVAVRAASARTLPTGKRIRELAGKVWFGLQMSSNAPALDKEIFASECNAGQFTHYPAWGGWPSQGSYGLPALGANIRYYVDAGMPSMMHMFVGPDKYLPDWFKNGTWDKVTMEGLLKALIQDTLSAPDAAKVSVWNIVNEALSWDGKGWEATKLLELGYEPDASGLTGSDRIFTQVPVYVRLAFEYARQRTGADLELRDYQNDGLETRSGQSVAKTKSFYQLVMHLRAKKAPVTAVGFQGHCNIDTKVTWSKLTDSVKRYRDLGLKVFITEMDTEQNDNVKTWNATIAQAQGEHYYQHAKAALAGGVNGIFTWGVRDNQDKGWLYGENALLFDAAGEPKQAYYGIQRAFAEAALTAGGPDAGRADASAVDAGRADASAVDVGRADRSGPTAADVGAAGAAEARLSATDAAAASQTDAATGPAPVGTGGQGGCGCRTVAGQSFALSPWPVVGLFLALGWRWRVRRTSCLRNRSGNGC